MEPYEQMAADLADELSDGDESLESAFARGYAAGASDVMRVPSLHVAAILRDHAEAAGRRTFHDPDWLREWLRGRP